MLCERDRERGLRIQAKFAVSYVFEDERFNRVLCGDCADDSCEDDPDASLRLLEKGERRRDLVW